MSELIVYTMEGCPYCAKIKGELDSKHISYEEREISSFKDEFQKLKDEHGVKTVPTSVVNGKVIVGSDKVNEIEKELR